MVEESHSELFSQRTHISSFFFFVGWVFMVPESCYLSRGKEAPGGLRGISRSAETGDLGGPAGAGWSRLHPRPASSHVSGPRAEPHSCSPRQGKAPFGVANGLLTWPPSLEEAVCVPSAPEFLCACPRRGAWCGGPPESLPRPLPPLGPKPRSWQQETLPGPGEGWCLSPESQLAGHFFFFPRIPHKDKALKSTRQMRHVRASGASTPRTGPAIAVVENPVSRGRRPGG